VSLIHTSSQRTVLDSLLYAFYCSLCSIYGCNNSVYLIIVLIFTKKYVNISLIVLGHLTMREVNTLYKLDIAYPVCSNYP